MKPARILSLCLAFSFAMPLLPPAAHAESAPLAQRIDELHQVLNRQWQYTLQTQPELASLLGDRRYNDRLRSLSPAAIDRDLQQAGAFLLQLSAIDTHGFPEQEQLNYELMQRQLKQQLAGAKFRDWEMPVDQFDGIHVQLPQLVAALRFQDLKDYQDYAARLEQVPRLFQETTEQMRLGLQHGLMPAKILLTEVATQADAVGTQAAEATVFAQPLAHFPPGIDPAAQENLRSRILSLIKQRVLPAYRAFARFARDEYAPHGRSEIGLWALPDGDARYARAIAEQTTTDKTPEQIYQLGLSEVARIEAEQMAIIKPLGFNDLKRFNDSLKQNPKVHPASAEQILAEFRHYIGQMQQQLPKLFGRLPKAKLEVVPVEAFRQKQAPAASYSVGSPDGSRSGQVFVNTYDYAQQLTITNESTAYHEGVPGHHLQKSIAEELPQLPPFRQQANYTAFVEGWAVYTEHLGKEVGFYQNPYNDYGRLEDEKWRAIRLVVDTGTHYKRWPREQMVQYMRDHSSASEDSIQAETDRYIALPAQALAYKIGQLSILHLRQKAERALAVRFDVKDFHDNVLSAGALPLDLLQQRIEAWSAHQLATAEPAND